MCFSCLVVNCCTSNLLWSYWNITPVYINSQIMLLTSFQTQEE